MTKVTCKAWKKSPVFSLDYKLYLPLKHSNSKHWDVRTQQSYLIHTNAVIPHKTSQQAHARLVTTLDLRHSCINTRPLPRYPRNLSVTRQQTKHDLCRYFTKPPRFTRDLCRTSVTLLSHKIILSTLLGINHLNTTPIRLFTLQHKILELSGSM